MVGDDADIEELTDDGQFSEPQWSASGHPFLARRLADLSVKVGARARFLVEVSSPTPVSVRWEKDGRTVEESDRIHMVTEGNFHCLDISPVCQEDGGLWRVKVTNIIGTTMSSAQLTLLVPKAYKKPEFVEPLRAILTAQGTVSLECKVIGVPTPLLRWFKGNNEIKAGDVLALTPTAADPTSLGTYTCLAANCMGTAESTSIVHIDGTPTTVQGFLPTGPKPIFVKELRNEKAKLGGSVTLECKVSVPPWPEGVNWYGPNGEVTENSRTHLMEDGTGLYSLKIASVNAEDNGTWKCVATNKHGAKSISSSLISVNYPKNYRKPKFLESLKAVLTEEGLVSFECKVVGYPTPNLSWFKDGQELKPGDVYQLTGTNSLGSYCCIARNCMGEAQSSAELTLEDIKSQLSEEEKLQLSSEKLPPRFIIGLKSAEAKINESLKLSVKVSVFPEPSVLWFRDDEILEEGERYKIEKDKLGGHHININKLEFCDQAEWKCIATNEYGQSVTSSYVKLNIPKHFKKPKFLEDLKAVMSEEGAVNLECKVIGVPQPKLKWFKDGKELKPGDIHKIISGQDGTCCLGTYTCLAQNCMGSVSSSASLLGFEEKGEKTPGLIPDSNTNGHALSRDRSLSTIHEERTSQLHDTDKSTTIDDRAEEVSFSFDGKEVSVSLYETPDLTEEEALQVVEMYAEQLSEHVTEQNVVELPPMRFTKESSTSGKLMMEAVVIDVSPEYFSSAPAPRKIVEDDLRTDADMDEFSLVEELNTGNLSPDRNLSPIENLTMDFPEKPVPFKPPRSKGKTTPTTPEEINITDEKPPLPKKKSKKRSTDSEKEDDSLQEFERQKSQNVQKVVDEMKKVDSELEDDSLYEFESRKTKDDIFKSYKEDEPYRYSTETGLVRTPENESQYYSPLKSPHTVVSKMTEDEATFDTAEDSAFDKSEMSVLETLAYSLHEIQKNLTTVEAHVASESSTGEMQSAQGITEFLAEPLAEVQKSLEIVEAQIQEFPAGKYSSDVLESLVQPISKFKKNLAMLEEKSLPSILESVAGPLEELNREISFIQKATQTQIEYAKSVEQVQESLTKIIERQASVPCDRKVLDSISSELNKLEEKANDDLEVYYDRLLSVGSELRSKANEEENQEIQDILKAVGDLVKPLKRLTAVTSKCIAVIVEDNQLGNIPTKKIVESLLKPLDALDATLSLLESVSSLKSHRAIRGAGIPILYKVSVPMDELETTIKLVENLSAQSAVEFLILPLHNLTKVVQDIDVSTGGDGFLEDLEGEGTPIVKSLDDSLDIMLSCINSIHNGVSMVDSHRGIPGKLSALLKPMEDLQRSLKFVEKGMRNNDADYEEIHSIAQELAKPLQSIRSECSILQHEIEADHYSMGATQPHSPLTSLLEPFESVQSCISAFHETIMCKSADDPMHLRFILYALKELSEPLSSLSSKMIKSEEVLLGKGDPFQGLKAVARSVSELRESSSAVSTKSNGIERMTNVLSQPLYHVQSGLENILEFVDKKDKRDLNIDMLKKLEEPFKELQSALLEIEGNVHENVTEGVTPELNQAVQDLQRTILIIQEQSSFEYGDEPSTIEANIETLKSLTQPLQTLKAQFSEVQRSSTRTMIKAEKALTALRDSTRRVSATIAELKSQRSNSTVISILHSLGSIVSEMEAAVVDAKTYLGKGNRVDETRRILANSLRVASEKLSEVVSKADNMSVSVEPSKRKPLVLVQDFIHNLKVAVEQSTKVMDCDTGTAGERCRGALAAIEQLAQAMSSFHDQLLSVDEFTLNPIENRGIDVLKSHVDKLQNKLEHVLSSEVTDKNDKMILETIENDLKSVQRVLDNLLAEDASDNARMRFILAKAEAIHSDLKDIVKSDDDSNLKAACQAALSVIDAGESLMNRKSPLKMEILSQVEPEQEVSVIGELLENLNELDQRFNALKKEGKVKIAEKEAAEIAMELATLQALVQDIATEASGELLDKAVELCIPIKSIEVKLSQAKVLTPADLEETAESIHNINTVMNAAIRKKEAEKLLQPSTSIIGDLLEAVGDLEASFDRIKRNPLPKEITEMELNDVGREILSLQNIIDDLTSGATSELLDKAHDICVPIKSIESALKHYVILNREDVQKAKKDLIKINQELLDAIQHHDTAKKKREKEFEKLFSSDSLSTSVDIPIVRSIITTIEYMQAHLNSLTVPQEMVDTKQFLEKFECGLIRYGECLTETKNEQEMMDCISDMESALKTADMTRVELRKLAKAVEGLKTSGMDLSNSLPALQSVLSPLKTLHEELSRPNSPKQLKKAELKYLESFSKSSTDLEVGLMKLEKASIGGTPIDGDCMVIPVQQLSMFIENISREPLVQNLGEESSIHALKSLAQPIETIKIMVGQVKEAMTQNDKNKVSELLMAIAKPIRELRTNIALIQDQAMMDCSISQLDELKQAVALMTQVGTEMPALKQPLLYLQARLQELEPEAELAEVVGELSGPVGALKQAVEVLETKGENSMLLELCHQVVDIISKQDDTLSEMSSICQHTTRADVVPAVGHEKVATLCHDIVEDVSLTELTHTGDTFTPAHAAEQLPSIHATAVAAQQQPVEETGILESSSVSVNEAVPKSETYSGQMMKAALEGTVVVDDPTLLDIVDMSSVSATLAAENLASLKHTLQSEEKIPLEDHQSIDNSQMSTKEATEHVVCDQMSVAKQETDFLEDYSLSEISLNDGTGSAAQADEKFTSLRQEIATEEKFLYEQPKDLDSLLSVQEARGGLTSISGQLKVPKMGDIPIEEQNLTGLSTSNDVKLVTGSSKIVEGKHIAVVEDRQTFDQANSMSETTLSVKEVSAKDVSDRQSAKLETQEVLQAPSDVAIAQNLLEKELHKVSDFKPVVLALMKIPLPKLLTQKLMYFSNKFEELKSEEMLQNVYVDVQNLVEDFEKAVALEKPESSRVLHRFVERLKEQEVSLVDEVHSQMIEIENLLKGDQQDLYNLKKAVALLLKIPPIKKLGVQLLQNDLSTLDAKMQDLGPLTSPVEILQNTSNSVNQLKSVISQAEKKVDPQLIHLCQQVIRQVQLGEISILKESSQMLKEDTVDIGKLKKSIAILVSVPKQGGVEILNQPLETLQGILNSLGPLTKVEELFHYVVPSIKAIKETIGKVNQSSPVVKACQLVVEKGDKIERAVKDKLESDLKGELQDLTSLRKTMLGLVDVVTSEKVNTLEQPLKSVQKALDELSPLAESVDIFKAMRGPLHELKTAPKGEAPHLDRLCALLVTNYEKRKEKLLSEVSLLLEEEDSYKFQKAVTTMVEIIQDEVQLSKLCEPIGSLQATLESMCAQTSPTKVLKQAAKPTAQLSLAISELKQAKVQSPSILNCESIVRTIDRQKQYYLQEATELVKGDITSLKKGVAILRDIPVQHTQLGESVVALATNLNQLSQSSNCADVLKCVNEPIKALKRAASDAKKTTAEPQFLNVCQLVIDKIEQQEDEMLKEAKYLLKFQDASGLQKAVEILAIATAIHTQLNTPLYALKAQLDHVDPANISEILRCTQEPIRVLQHEMSTLSKSEKPELLELCQLLIEKNEDFKKVVYTEVEALLKQSTINLNNLQKAVALLVDIPKDKTNKIQQINSSLTALQAQLSNMKPEALELVPNVKSVKELKQVIETVKKSGESSQLMNVCELLIEKIQHEETPVLKKAVTILKANKQDVSNYQKAVAILINAAEASGPKVAVISEPLKALKAQLGGLGAAPKLEDIVRCTAEPIATLRLVLSTVEKNVGKSELLEVCQLLVDGSDESKTVLLSDVKAMLEESTRSVSSYQKAVTLLVDIPKDENQNWLKPIVKPLKALQAQLLKIKPEADAIALVRETLEPLNELKIVVRELKQSKEESQLLEICELVIEKVEASKELLLADAQALLKGDARSVTELKKAMAILIDLPLEKTHNASPIKESLRALHTNLDQLNASSKPEDIIKCIAAPVNRLNQLLSNVQRTAETSKLLEVCQLVFENGDHIKKVALDDLQKNLEKAAPSVSTLQKAVTVLVDIPKDKGQKLATIEQPLQALQAKLQNMKPDADPRTIIRETSQPLNDLKKVVFELGQTKEKSQLLEICEVIVKKAEAPKALMLQNAQKFLRGDLQDGGGLKKAVAIIVELPLDKNTQTNVREPLVALQAKLDQLGVTPKHEEVVKCCAEPVSSLKQVLSDVKKTEENAQVLELCRLIVENVNNSKKVLYGEVEAMLKAPVASSVNTLQKAVALLVDITKEETDEKSSCLDKPLKALQAQLNEIKPDAEACVVIRKTLQPMSELKRAVSELKQSKEKSQLFDICELIIEKVEATKIAIIREAYQLLKCDVQDVTSLKKVVDILLLELPTEDQKVSSTNEPLLALQGKLGQLSASSKPEDIVKCISEPITSLKQVLSNVQKTEENSSIVDVCQAIVEKGEECKKLVLSEVETLLKEPVPSANALEKAVALLVIIPKMESQKFVSIEKPMVALQAQLGKMKPDADAIVVIRGILQTLNELKKVVSELKQSKEKSQLLDLCEIVIKKTEVPKTLLLHEAEKVLKGSSLDLSGLQKGVALLVEFPLETHQKSSSVKKPLSFLQAKLDQLGVSPKPEDVIKCISEPIRSLKQEISNVRKLEENSQLLDICDLVLVKEEECKKAVYAQVNTMLSDSAPSVCALQGATKLLTCISVAEASSLDEPLQALQAQLQKIKSDCGPAEIVRGTLKPVEALEQAVAEVKQTKGKSQLVECCELVIGKVEAHKAMMLKQAEKLLKAELWNAGELRKGLAILIDFPLGKDKKVIQVKDSMSALQVKLNQLGTSPRLEEILTCTSQPMYSLKQTVASVQRTAGNAQFLDMCNLLIEQGEKGKNAVLRTIETLLNDSTSDVGSLQKAIALLVDIPKHEAPKIEEPLKALQSQLNCINIKSEPIEIMKSTAVPIKQLKQVVASRKAGEQSQLLDVCSTVIRIAESGKKEMLQRVQQLLTEKSCDPIRFTNAVGILLDVPEDEVLEITNDTLRNLRIKLLQLSTSSKPHEVFSATYETILEIRKLMTTMNKEFTKSETFDTCRLIQDKTHQLIVAMEDEALDLLSEETLDIVKLRSAAAIAIDVLKESGKKVSRLNEPLGALHASITLLTTASESEEVVQKTLSKVCNLKRVVSQLKEIGEPSRVVKICDHIVTKAAQHKDSLLQNVINSLEGPVIDQQKLQSAVTVVFKVVTADETLSKPFVSSISLLNDEMQKLSAKSNARSISKQLEEPISKLKQALSSFPSCEEQQVVKSVCHSIIKVVESAQEVELSLRDVLDLINEGISTISQLGEAIEVLNYFSNDCEVLKEPLRDCKNQISFLHASYKIEEFVSDLLPSIKSLYEGTKKVTVPNEFSTTAVRFVQHLDRIFHLSKQEKVELLKIVEEKKEKELEERKKREEEEAMRIEESNQKEIEKRKEEDEKKRLKEERKLNEEQEINKKQELEMAMEEEDRRAKELEKKKEQERKNPEEAEGKKKEEEGEKLRENTKKQECDKKNKEGEEKIKQIEKENKQKEEAESRMKEKEQQAKKTKEEEKKNNEMKKEKEGKNKAMEEEINKHELEKKKVENEESKQAEDAIKSQEELERKKSGEQKKNTEPVKIKKDVMEENAIKLEKEREEKEEKINEIKSDAYHSTEEENTVNKKAPDDNCVKIGNVEVEKNRKDTENQIAKKQEDAIGQGKKQEEENKKQLHERLIREKQKSLVYVNEILEKGLTVVSQFKEVVEIMSHYKHVCEPLADPLDALTARLLSLNQKSKISDFVPEVIQPMLKLKQTTETVSNKQNGLLIACESLLIKLEPLLGLKGVERKERMEVECEKRKKLKEIEEAKAKENRIKEEELQKERIDADLRKARSKMEQEKQEAERKRKRLREEQLLKPPQQEIQPEAESFSRISSRKTQDIHEEASVKSVNDEKKTRKQKILEDAERKENEIKEAREKERKLREEQLLLIQQKREQYEDEERIRKDIERNRKEAKDTEERKKLEQVKEEVEERERSIKAKLEQVKKEKKELEVEEHNKIMRAWKQERERRDQEEATRKEREQERAKYQREKEEEMKKLRLKNLEKREEELEKMKSRESLRVAHLTDLHKREVAKGISKSLDAVYLSSLEKLSKDTQYSASATIMSPIRDVGVHSTRGISVIELMDFPTATTRPERTKKSGGAERGMRREITDSRRDSRLRDVSPDIRRRADPNIFSSGYADSNEDTVMRSWDRFKEQNWRNLEYPTAEYESPAGYHRSRRSISPIGDSSYNLRYQAAPQPTALAHRSRRSLSPLERSINQPYSGSTVSLTSLGARKYMDELTSARFRPPTPTRSYVPSRSRSITKLDHRAFIVNGLSDKTVIHGGKIRLSCNIGGDPNPSIEWLKDGKSIAYHTESSRYKTECNYGVACLEVEGTRLSDAGQYTCVVKNMDGQTATTCTVRVALKDDDERELETIENELEANMPREVCLSIKGSAFGMPRVTGLVADPVVPSGGTIAVHVQVAGCHRPEVTWLHGGAPLPKYSPRVHYFEDGGLFTLLLEGATPAESGVYTCRVSGRGRGAIDTATTVQVVEKRGFEKPALFTAKPDTRMTLTCGDDMTLTCYVGGEPRPQVILMKGIKDITTSCRTLKEVFGEYVRLTLKRVNLEDGGTYFIVAKNIYGTDRTFVTLDVRERQNSPSPPTWSERTSSLTSLYKETHHTFSSWRSTGSLHSSYPSLYE